MIASPDKDDSTKTTGEQKRPQQAAPPPDNSSKGQYLLQINSQLNELNKAENFKEAEKVVNAALDGEFKEQYTTDDMVALYRQKAMFMAFQRAAH
jgi:hypothetical protein